MYFDKHSFEMHYLFTKQQSFRLFKIESICRQHNKCDYKMLKFDLGRTEIIVGKGENAGYHNVFKRLFFPGLLRVRNVWQRAIYILNSYYMAYSFTKHHKGL